MKILGNFANRNKLKIFYSLFCIFLPIYLDSYFDKYKIIYVLVLPFFFHGSWVLFLTLFFRFQEENKDTKDLYHYTPFFEEIKKTSYLLPSADAAVYFTDKQKNLGSSTKKDNKRLVFKDAKNSNEFIKITSKTIMWDGFKMARCEWRSKPKKIIKIEINAENQPKENGDVLIENYQIIEPPDSMVSLLSKRYISSFIIPNIFLLLIITTTCIAQVVYFTAEKFYKNPSIYLLLIYSLALMIGFCYQDKFNKDLIKKLYDSLEIKNRNKN